MPSPQPLSLPLAFAVKDELAGTRRQKSLTYYAGPSRKVLLLSPYTKDSTNYKGPPVMECSRPIPRRNNHGSICLTGDENNLPRSKEGPEPIDLFTRNGKQAVVPVCIEGDEYLKDFVKGLLQQKDFLSLVECEIEVQKFFEIYDDDRSTRLRPIWDHAARELQADTNESLQEQINEVKENQDKMQEHQGKMQEQVDGYGQLLAQISRKLKIEDDSTDDLHRLSCAVLTQEEQQAIREHTVDYFESINSALSPGSTAEQAVSQSKELIESGLRKLPNFVGTVYGIQKTSASKRESFKKRFPKDRIAKPFSAPIFVYGSWEKDMGFQTDDSEVLYNLMEIKSLTGKKIGPYSAHPLYCGVVFPPETPFVVTQWVDSESGQLLVRFEEVEKDDERAGTTTA